MASLRNYTYAVVGFEYDGTGITYWAIATHLIGQGCCSASGAPTVQQGANVCPAPTFPLDAITQPCADATAWTPALTFLEDDNDEDSDSGSGTRTSCGEFWGRFNPNGSPGNLSACQSALARLPPPPLSLF